MNVFSELNQANNRNGDLLTEISRLQAENAELRAELEQVESENEHHMRLAFVDAGANPARTWKEEAERLAALAQSDAEPVAGLAKARTIALEQRCERGTPWDLACVTIANKIGEHCGYPSIPTDTAPPRPDISAELIERVARAICLVRYNDPDRRMPICEENSDGPPIWTTYTRHARAAIEVIRPDTSAGLIEAARIAEEWDSGWGEDRNTRVARETATEIAEAIRARAANASSRPESAGLIEAAEIAEALAFDFSGHPIRNVIDILSGLAKNLRNRARAADRSEK